MRYMMLCLLAGLVACSESDNPPVYTKVGTASFDEGLLSATTSSGNAAQCTSSATAENLDDYTVTNIDTMNRLGVITDGNPETAETPVVAYTGTYDMSNLTTCFTGRIADGDTGLATGAAAAPALCTAAQNGVLKFTACTITDGALSGATYTLYGADGTTPTGLTGAVTFTADAAP